MIHVETGESIINAPGGTHYEIGNTVGAGMEIKTMKRRKRKHRNPRKAIGTVTGMIAEIRKRADINEIHHEEIPPVILRMVAGDSQTHLAKWLMKNASEMDRPSRLSDIEYDARKEFC